MITSHTRIPATPDHCADIRSRATRHPVQLIIDVGANVGVTVRNYLRQFETARVIAFEPIQTTFATLQANLRGACRVCCVNLALGCLPATVRVHHQHHPAMNSLHPPINVPPPDRQTSELVNVITLDQFVRDNQIEHIDVLKLDTEHFDLEVVQGGQRTLAERRVSFIYSEVSFEPKDQQHTNYAHLAGHLAAHGFELIGFYEHVFRPNSDVVDHCNALFMHLKR